MKRQVLPLLLRLTARLMCCVLLADLILISEPLLAEQAQEIRLFHEPINNDMDDVMNGVMGDFKKDAWLINLNRLQAMPGDIQSPSSERELHKAELIQADLSTAKLLDTGGDVAYQYNGFISTASSKHFLVNGLPLNEISSLILVSVELGGKSLVLKTPNGRLFELAVGQSISKDSL